MRFENALFFIIKQGSSDQRRHSCLFSFLPFPIETSSTSVVGIVVYVCVCVYACVCVCVCVCVCGHACFAICVFRGCVL